MRIDRRGAGGAQPVGDARGDRLARDHWYAAVSGGRAGAVLDAVGVRELPGPGVYEAGDPSWAESLLNYAKTAVLIDSGQRPIAFPTHLGGIDPLKSLVPVNEGSRQIKIAVVGDNWTALSKC